MSRPLEDILAEEVLSQLERKENQLLEWGIIGGAIDAEAEIASLLNRPPTPVLNTLFEQLHVHESDIHAIIQNLLERKLLFPVGDRYRSRYAETIRLLYLLKQRFDFKDWQSGRNLVSHVKPLLSYRKYPRRDRKYSEIESKLKEIRIDEFVIGAVRILLGDGQFELAQFQVDALIHLLDWFRQAHDHGTIVGAGTGSGKTKAFYVPALAQLSSLVQTDPRAWTKVIGIYPRVELLKDQFREAVQEISKLKPYLTSKGTRSLSIGCYYGDTPLRALDVVQHEHRKWKKQNQAYVCPFFLCPECGGAMLWDEDDVKKEIQSGQGKYERLHCEHVTCGFRLGNDQIVLTRKRMTETPPDILFTSTEMLNRKLTSGEERHLFGVDAIEPPLFVLMDEVHIYEGVSGAHVAYLLRRWRKYMKGDGARGTHFVGLSATLSNPESFFSQLTGLKEDRITYVTPAEQDMTSEGMEYNLVVRGDPFSSASLLSTSVQTAMLIGRMLDPLDHDVSRGAMGSKLFGFTDKLDVINRWYHIEIDAEKRNALSRFRDPELFETPYTDTIQAQILAGQVWLAAKMIYNDSLRRPMELDLTSSQHKGVKENAKFVIATSTLEVGYNDTKVGAVIQHKAPRNLASFLQRKGRAGRVRGMRPWMIVVTSAFGRDRYVYDYPEQLFSPTLNDLSLPLRNSYIQRIQMAFAWMEFLTQKLRNVGIKIDTRTLLTERCREYPEEKRKVIQWIRDIMDGQDHEWRQFLLSALQITEADLERLLWTPPRSFYFELLPTLLIQLETDFAFAREEQKETALLGFIPRTLFTALDVSELTFTLPNGRMETMGLVQGMIEFAPGNVSKRFVHADKTYEAHWVTSDSDMIDCNGNEIKSRVIETVEVNGEKVPICEPYAMQLTQIPKEISDRSTGFHSWAVHIEPFEMEARPILFSNTPACKGLFEQVKSFSSNDNNYVKMTRYSTKVNAEVKYNKGTMPTAPRIYSFKYNEKPAFLGFQRLVDSLMFQVAPFAFETLFSHEDWDELALESKPTFYVHLLKQDPEIRSLLNLFEIDWLAQVTLSSVIATSVSRQTDLDLAIQEFAQKTVPIAKRTLEVIYQSTIVTSALKDEASEDSQVYRRLVSLIENAPLMNRFLQHLKVLNQDLREHPAFIEWLDITAVTTIAAAIQSALTSMLPDVNTEDLLLDIEGHRIWISEGESGGLGIVSKIAAVLQHSPSKFEEHFLYALDSCPRHNVSSSLVASLGLLDDQDMQMLLKRIRGERMIEKQQELLNEFQRKLDLAGIPPKREFIVSVSAKMLRNQASAQTDAFMRELHELWQAESQRIGCKIDPNVFAVACLSHDHIKAKVDELMGQTDMDDSQRHKQRYLFIESLLLSDCKDSCPECLEVYSPFQTFVKPSRILVQQLIQPSHEVIQFGDPDWKEKIVAFLSQGKRIRVMVPSDQRASCQQDMLDLIHTPIEAGVEMYYPFFEGVHNEGNYWYYDLRIREVTHV